MKMNRWIIATVVMAFVMLILVSNNMIPHVSTGNSEKDIVVAGTLAVMVGTIIVQSIKRLTNNILRLKKENEK